MLFYCRHYQKQISNKKGKSYCFDQMSCWALKLFFRLSDLKRYEKRQNKKTQLQKKKC